MRIMVTNGVCTMYTFIHHPHINQMKDGVPWPKIYGGGVEVETGEVFTAQVLFLTIVECHLLH